MRHAIHLVSTRAKLAPRREPYWGPRLEAGLYLGYRSTENGGYWIARQYDPHSHPKQRSESLGNAAFKTYDDACAEARDWAKRVLAGAVTKDMKTVRDACEAYVRDRRQEKGEAMAKECDQRFTRYLYGKSLARLPLGKVRKSHLKEWRAGLSKRDGTPLSDASKNRVVGSLISALYYAKAERAISAEQASNWAELEQLEVTTRRDVYLTPAQRKALIAALPESIRPVVMAMNLLPMRPGAVNALTVDNIEPHTGQLKIAKDKKHAGRSVKLPEATLTWFIAQADGKPSHAPLFAKPDGAPWTRQDWGAAIRDARIALKLPAGTCAYTLRHSTITDLLVAGVPTLTVARIAGTSVVQIEDTYGHLTEQQGTDALARLAL